MTKRNIIHILFLALFSITIFYGRDTRKKIQNENKTLGEPKASLSNAGNISAWYRHDGFIERNPYDNSSGVTFPRGTGQLIYASGLVWGGKVKDGDPQILRVGGGTYNIGLQGGKILPNRTSEPQSEPSVRIFRIRADWQTANLRMDAAEIYSKKIEAVTDLDIGLVRTQYQIDWNEWPWEKGAPFYDLNHNGIKEQNEDPGFANATQVLWFVSNDLDGGKTNGLYGSKPIGLEMQTTIWSNASSGMSGNLIYRRHKLIYKGTPTTPDTAHIDSMYISEWCDPDLGDYGDDFAGCDTTLGLGFVYNSKDIDADYSYYNLPPPAAGYDFLQGPMVYTGNPNDRAVFDLQYRYGYKNLPMTSFIYFAAGGIHSDPTLGAYEGTNQWYNLLLGRPPRPTGPPPPPELINPATGQPTHYWNSGDPITGTGWVDGMIEPTGDRRLCLNSGPFKMALGDTQEVVCALLASLGSSHLSSLALLKSLDRVVQEHYDTLFSVPIRKLPTLSPIVREYVSPTLTRLYVQVDGVGTNSVSMNVSLKLVNNTLVTSAQLFDDGMHFDGEAGDKIFGNILLAVPNKLGAYLDLNVTMSDGENYEFSHAEDYIAIAGELHISSYQIVSDNLNNDSIANQGENIRYVWTLENNAHFNFDSVVIKLSPNPEVKYSFFPVFDSLSSFSLIYDPNNPASYYSFNIPTDYEDSLFKIIMMIKDKNYNSWKHTLVFPVQPIRAQHNGSTVHHSTGMSDWEFGIRVVDSNATTNHVYEISVVDSIDTNMTKGFTLKDLSNQTTLLQNNPLPDTYGHNIPVSDGFKVMQGKEWGVVGLDYPPPDSTRWIPSFSQWFDGAFSTWDGRNTNYTFLGGVRSGEGVHDKIPLVQSVFPITHSTIVEIRFDTLQQQKAYRLKRSSNDISINSSNPYRMIPFSAWDVFDSLHPRQLTIAWIDGNNNNIWDRINPTQLLEYVLIYNKNYDSTGTTQFNMPPNTIPNEPTQGEKADIMYGLFLKIKSGHIINENKGTLYIRPYLMVRNNDLFTFTPTVLSAQDNTQYPFNYSLSQNYPNPFNPTTFIKFSLPQKEKVQLKIFDILGREITTVVNEVLEAGEYRIPFNGEGISSGVYFYRIAAGKYFEVRKMVLLK